MRFIQPLTEKLDIYSMAMIFYSMLAGHPPFEGEKGALKKIMGGIPPKVDRSWNTDFMDVSTCHYSAICLRSYSSIFVGPARTTVREAAPDVQFTRFGT